VSDSQSLDRDVTDLLKRAEFSLKSVVDEEFLERNDYLRKRFSDDHILEVFRFCLMRPGGHHWSPVYQVLLLLFQAAFSESYKTSGDHFAKLGNYLIHRVRGASKPVIYSFGVGNDVSFDVEAARLFGVPIYMYDPTPNVALFMKDYEDNERLIFKKEGIYSRDAEVKLHGVVGLPELARPTAKYQYLYLNARPIRDRFIQHALREAYRGLTEPGRQPAGILLIEVPPQDVDVNVHPTKSEVRFRDSGRIHGLVMGVVRESLFLALAGCVVRG